MSTTSRDSGHGLPFELPCVIALALAACGTEATEATSIELGLDAVDAAGRANVLLIIADDVGVAEIGAYGSTIDGASPGITTNIDALASNGVRFDRAWSNPVCSPTRATIYTGRYSFRTGVGDVITTGGDGELARSETTIADALSQAGYRTGLAGKWHLGTTDGDADAPRVTGGFDLFAGSLGGALRKYWRWERTLNGTTETCTTYATTQNVIDATRGINRSTGPWMATVAFNAAHDPYHVPTSGVTDPPDDCTIPRDCFQAMIEAMDTEIGLLLAEIDTANTWVIFVGDNGTPGDVKDPDVSLRGAKDTLYEGGIRVPLIVWGPGVVPGVVYDPVNTTDIYATIAELAGAGSIAEDSVSLVPYLEGGAPASPRGTVYAENFADEPHDGTAAMGDGNHKIIEDHGILTECYEWSDGDESDDLLADGDTSNDQPCRDLHDSMEAYHQ